MRYRASLLIYLKEGVLDTQGRTILRSLHDLGYGEVQDVRVGKYLRITLEAADESAARRRAEAMCSDLLVNDLIEEYSLVVEEEGK
ncbi:phosphoribosylformylglycinamidine synthase subunit PurS [Acetomicrobium sp. S15 = DSM 107314]|jgi:phosphoribosylformylglycinamidine synthase PurS subunit|uniref:phosphoribosylformylglycinamidine synthase subunit PurS n=1 Tax=Acetomicrobium sp. S15 = DSM 107314 TaxID=2529858 RepID=UPI0018E1AE52|nr:phosphoribosylformylglycinamidine synthase subunit PurS [Acetomicrobium sp. S15 = DSM 107314]